MDLAEIAGRAIMEQIQSAELSDDLATMAVEESTDLLLGIYCGVAFSRNMLDGFIDLGYMFPLFGYEVLFERLSKHAFEMDALVTGIARLESGQGEGDGVQSALDGSSERIGAILEAAVEFFDTIDDEDDDEEYDYQE